MLKLVIGVTKRIGRAKFWSHQTVHQVLMDVKGDPRRSIQKKSRKTDGVVSIADDNEKFETDSESVNCAETNPDSSADEETLLLKSVSTRIAGGLLGVKRISLLKTESGRVPDRFLIWYDSYSVRSS